MLFKFKEFLTRLPQPDAESAEWSNEFRTHRAVKGLFGDAPAAAHLTETSLILRSVVPPAIELPSQEREIETGVGTVLCLSVRLCPSGTGGGRERRARQGAKVGEAAAPDVVPPIRDRRLSEEDVLARLEAYGIKATDARVVSTGRNHRLFWSSEGKAVYANDVKHVFGAFVVTEEEAFRRALLVGVGSRRSYGYGFIDVVRSASPSSGLS